MKAIAESELIINNDGSIFHLHLKPEQIADTVFLVGDPARVTTISDMFDTIEHKVQNREFVTHTGIYKGKRFSALATGIGTDNIDIVINELDALVNVDLKTRKPKSDHKSLNLIRLGTSGGLQEDLDIDSFLMTETSIGFDGLLNFYKNRDAVCKLDVEKEFLKHMNWNPKLASPYFIDGSKELLEKLGQGIRKGITISAPGFYGPQARVIRLEIQDPEINDKIRSFNYENKKITNYEMESSALFGLSALLGHKAATICVIIANRYAGKYSKDYKPAVKKLIETVLNRLV
ncbi:MAG: nucleoside phosphorylase [Bacteroidales bacterium]|nr:nucleoside phosphorylase [Bacteroidales bacterium]